MKKIYLAFITLVILFTAVSCDSNLPFPTDEIKRGVVIDIVRTDGTDGVLYRDETDGNYSVTLTIPEQQGDYSFMSHAQLLGVFTAVDGTTTSKVIKDNITTFPANVDLDIAEIYALFGLDAPSLGETLNITTNAVLKDGYVVQGWSESAGYNNRAFVGWRLGSRAYSYNVRYSVVCALDIDSFVGTNTVILDDWWGETPYQVEVTKVGDYELSIAGLFNGEATNPLVIKIDPVDYSISFDRQILAPNSGSWWENPAYNNFAFGNGDGVVDACETGLYFSATGHVDAGNFSGRFAIQMTKD
jgi:hypothetical protein